MARIHRLNSSEARAWRINQPLLVNEEGGILRTASKEECAQDFELKKQGGQLELKTEGKLYRLETTREVMKRLFLTHFGECILKAPNGRFLAFVRDPTVERPSPKDALKYAPNPENCQCRDWHGREPGKHHRICKFNNAAPADERGDVDLPKRIVPPKASADIVIPKIVVPDVQKPQTLPAPQEQETAAPVITIPSPDECVCRSFSAPPKIEPHQHNPICQFYSVWKEAHPEHVPRPKPEEAPQLVVPETPEAAALQQTQEEQEELLSENPQLVDVDTGLPVRDATPEEIAEAAKSLKETGVPLVYVAGKAYALLDPSGDVFTDIDEEQTSEADPCIDVVNAIASTTPKETAAVLSQESSIFDFDEPFGAD